MNERAALTELSRFLADHDASLQTIDAAGLNELERGYMREVRRFVPCARLIGVPRRVERRWLAFARLYCAYLLASGRPSSSRVRPSRRRERPCRTPSRARQLDIHERISRRYAIRV